VDTGFTAVGVLPRTDGQRVRKPRKTHKSVPFDNLINFLEMANREFMLWKFHTSRMFYSHTVKYKKKKTTNNSRTEIIIIKKRENKKKPLEKNRFYIAGGGASPTRSMRWPVVVNNFYQFLKDLLVIFGHHAFSSFARYMSLYWFETHSFIMDIPSLWNMWNTIKITSWASRAVR